MVLAGDFSGSVNFGGTTFNSWAVMSSWRSTTLPVRTCGNCDINGGSADKCNQNTSAVAVRGNSNLALIGYFYFSINFGGGPLMSVGYEDIFPASFAP